MSESPSGALDVRVAMETDIGRKRQQNQDAIGQLVPDDPNVLARLGQIVVLADGVGGLPGGDLASQYAVSTILSSYYDETYEEEDPAKRLARAIAEANSVIYDEGQSRTPPSVMATTVVAAVIRDRDLIIGSVGDSPAYLLRDDEVRQLTQDHNLENLQRAAGEEPPEDSAAGHKLVRALGHNERVKVDIITGRVRHGDCVILCSDGLTRYADPDEIGAMVAEMPIGDAVVALVDAANARGGADNISVVVIQLIDEAQSLLNIKDPMEHWGQPRRGDRGSRPDRPRVQPASPRAEPRAIAVIADEIIQFVRSNTVTTGIALGALLIVFVIIVIIISGVGGDSGGSGRDTSRPNSEEQTATAVAGILLTDEVNLAATEAAVAQMTLTPPTPTLTPSPAPTSGPMLDTGIWFRVLDGDPIPAYAGPSFDADDLTVLDAGSNYRVMGADRLALYGPWYEVVDNLGTETRWVNGPSLHQRVLAVNEAGDPLPEASQPLDVPPAGTAWNTPTPRVSPEPSDTPAPTVTGTPPTATPTPEATETPDIAYGVESWDVGDRVVLKADLDLCRIPDVDACDAGAGTIGTGGIITDGPVGAGEHWWWEVELPDGRAGWIAQVLLGPQ